MPNILYPMCALMGHCWEFVRKSRNYVHYECEICGRRGKDDR